MIAGAAGRSTVLGRRGLVVAAAAALAGCAGGRALVVDTAAPVRDGVFVMPDGALLPFRAWLPAAAASAGVLALHGFNDSRDAFELCGPALAGAGFSVYAPDQRGFGESPGRGRWAGAAMLSADAGAMVRQLRERHDRVFVLGESMGGAVAMRLAVTHPEVGMAGAVLAAPAVRGRASMGALLRVALWVGAHGFPEASIVDGGPVRVRATDNIEALRRLSRDPLTLHTTRIDMLRGLVDLMDDAVAAAPRLPPSTLLLYGAHDEVVPAEAMRAAWRQMPQVRRLLLPNGYHLLLRDRARARAVADIATFLRDPGVPADAAAATAGEVWLAGRS